MTDIEAHMLLFEGDKLMREGKDAMALEKLEVALKIYRVCGVSCYRQHADTCRFLAELHMHKRPRDADKTVRLLRESETLWRANDPGNNIELVKTLGALGESLLFVGDIKGTILVLKEAITIAPTSVDMGDRAYNLALAYQEDGQLETAFEGFRSVVEEGSSNTGVAYLGMGRCAMRLVDRSEDALRYFTEAAKHPLPGNTSEWVAHKIREMSTSRTITVYVNGVPRQVNVDF
jgi:tetratricopeptide (TPR) repeat protein